MAPEATGLARMAKAITKTMIATPASASTIGSAGGRLHLALSNSSVMGTWPALGWAAGVFDGVVGGWGASGMLGCLLKRESYAGTRFRGKGGNRGNRRHRRHRFFSGIPIPQSGRGIHSAKKKYRST